MPRLNHKKTRTGCLRCKARKVKCDERQPQCTACARHNVLCQYVNGPSTRSEHSASVTPPTNGSSYNIQPAQNGPASMSFDPMLELRLMHEWTAHTCKTLTTAWEFWCYHAPLVAMECRYLLDAMMAVTAHHASRQPAARWNPIDGRMIPITKFPYDPAREEGGLPIQPRWRQLHDRSILNTVVNELNNFDQNSHLRVGLAPPELLAASRMYFDRALEGFRHAVNHLTSENIEAVFITSMLTSFNALLALGGDEDDATSPPTDPSLWLRLGRGTYHVIQKWQEFVGFGWIAHSGTYYGTPDLSNDEWIFLPEHGKMFGKLLTFATDFEASTEEDKRAYRLVLSYLGVIYKGIVEGTDFPLATYRRMVAMPAKCPPRFVDLVEAKQPRALVMLAHLFAAMRMIEHDAEWLSGVAERQVPRIYEQLPVGWREMMAWPMAVSQGDVTREPTETQVDEIPTL